MRPIEIEAWALRVVDKVKLHAPVEDARVELKRTWPEPAKVARQIGGHANAARGDDLLWLIGLDETDGVNGAPKEELADWLPQVNAEFESVCPEIYAINIHQENVVLVALHIRTDRAPYSVRIAAFGKVAGCAAQWEIPWREGNRTRTAARSDLLRMLIPKVEQPQFEILQASGVAQTAERTLTVRQKIYVIPQRAMLYVFPKHKVVCLFRLGEELVSGKGTLHLYSSQAWGETMRNIMTARPTQTATPRVTVNALPEAVEVTDTEIVVRAPGALELQSTVTSERDLATDLPLTIETFFESAHDRVTCCLTSLLHPRTGAEGQVEWHPRTYPTLRSVTVS